MKALRNEIVKIFLIQNIDRHIIVVVFNRLVVGPCSQNVLFKTQINNLLDSRKIAIKIYILFAYSFTDLSDQKAFHGFKIALTIVNMANCGTTFIIYETICVWGKIKKHYIFEELNYFLNIR